MTSFTVVLPDQIKPFTDITLLALTIWREASGEALAAKHGVAWVIRNRVDHPGWWGTGWHDVVTKKAQFTSMTPPDHMNDPGLRRYPRPDDPSWADAVRAAFDVMVSNVTDPTGGATYYFDRSLDKNPPAWAAQFTHTADIGNFHFFKENNK